MSTSGRHFLRDHADLGPRERKPYEHPQITDNRTLREALPPAVREGASDNGSQDELG